MSGSLQLSHSSSEKLALQDLSGESDPVEVWKYQLDGVKGAVSHHTEGHNPPISNHDHKREMLVLRGIA